MIVYVSTIKSPFYKYLASWVCNGLMYTDKFRTKKELKEYTATWENVKLIFD